jgi:hypothetical protein
VLIKEGILNIGLERFSNAFRATMSYAVCRGSIYIKSETLERTPREHTKPLYVQYTTTQVKDMIHGLHGILIRDPIFLVIAVMFSILNECILQRFPAGRWFHGETRKLLLLTPVLFTFVSVVGHEIVRTRTHEITTYAKVFSGNVNSPWTI